MLKLIIFIVMLSGCAQKMSEIQQPTKKSFFTLTKDVYKSELEGLFKYHWIAGLRAGTYSLIGEDSEGYYYEGKGDAIYFLKEESADLYLETKYIPSYSERFKNQAPAGGKGGIWFPKNLTKEEPQVYFILYTPESGGVALGGAIHSVILSTINGSIQKMPLSRFGLDKNSIQIIDE